LLLIVTSGLLAAFYVLVSKLIRRIFFEGSADSSYLKSEARDTGNILSVAGNLFVHALPGSDKGDLYDTNNGIRYIDLNRELPEHISLPALDVSGTYIITGMNPVRTGIAVTEKHIALLEHLRGIRQRVILISAINEERFAASIGEQQPDLLIRWEQLRKTMYHVNAGISRISKQSLLSSSDRCEFATAVIAGINASFARSHSHSELTPAETGITQQACAELIEKLVQECRHTKYLPSCFFPLFDFARNMSVSIFDDIAQGPRGAFYKVVNNRLKFVFENTCLQLKEMAANYYEELWSALDLDEQRTIYDVAIDDLVNPSNRNVAARLAELEIIKAEPFVSCYRVFNSSFRSFVFDHVAKTEIKAFKAEIKQQGRTGNILMPLGIVILAAVIFIFSTQKDAFLDLITYLGAAAAGITGILKLISIIPTSKSSSS
jgi:hypothetical protein